VRTHRLKTRLTAIAIALLTPLGAHAAGLGSLNIRSALGQALNAEIELLAVKQGETITARLAPLEVYQKSNAQLNPALNGTRITVEKRANGQPYLKVTSPRAIQEPYIELIVELNSESGRVTRQYTALLDPPGYGRGPAENPPKPQAQPPAAPGVEAPSEPAAPVAERAPDPAPAPAPPAAAPPPAVAASPAAAVPPSPPARAKAAAQAPALPRAESSAASAGKEYGPIKAGETLGSIARTVKPEGATLEQTLIALQRQNPDAFIHQNINLVRSGKILKVPEASEISAVTPAEAVREMKVQIADFNALRQRIAERVAVAPDSGSTSRGRITAAVSDPASTEPRDTVRVSRSEPGVAGGAGSKSADERIRILEEEAVVRQRALAEANERIGHLEKTIKDMQRLVELKNSAAQKAPEQTAAKAPAEQTASKAPEPKPPLATESVVMRPSTGDDNAKAGARAASAPAETARNDAFPPPAAGASSNAGGAGQTQVAANASGATKLDAAVSPKPAVSPITPAAETQPSFFEEVLREPLYLALSTAVALLAGLGVVTARRRRTAAAGRAAEHTIAPTPGTAASVGSAPVPVRAEPTPSTPPAAPAPGAAATRNDNDLDFHDSPPASKVASAAGVSSTALGVAGAPPSPAPTLVPAPAAEPVRPRMVPAEAVAATAPAAAGEAAKLTPGPQPAAPESQKYRLSGAGEPADAALSSPQPAAKPSNVVDFDLESPEPARRPMDDERVPSEPPPRDFEFKLDLNHIDLDVPEQAKSPLRDDHWYDVQQKFDLAKAYEEMGDRSGARDILREVLKEGDREQQDKATKLLATLA
jgi:pilus assembly protein FimV